MKETIVRSNNLSIKNVFILILILMLVGCVDVRSINQLEELGLTGSHNLGLTQKSNPREFGVVTLEASTEFSSSNSSQYFSFENNNYISENYAESDIHFGLTQTSTPFLILSPSPLSKGVQIENHFDENDATYVTFNKKECLNENLNYGSGGMPIPFVNSKYCWITNDGNIVEFVITEITKIIDEQITYRITIEYVIWKDD